MGMYSYFSFAITPDLNLHDEVAEEANIDWVFSNCEFDFDCMENFEICPTTRTAYFRGSQDMNWDNFEDDLKSVSEELTNCSITVRQEGSNWDGYIEHVFRNSKHASSEGTSSFWNTQKEQIARAEVLSDVVI